MHYIASGKKDGRAGTGCKTLQGAVTVYNGCLLYTSDAADD